MTPSKSMSASLFLSTPSARRATYRGLDRHRVQAISIHALREEGDLFFTCPPYADLISIHALREEGDPWPRGRRSRAAGISIHALREEGDGGVGG